jgi:hypothetical protein
MNGGSVEMRKEARNHSMHGVGLKPDEWMERIPNNGWETVRRHIAVQLYGMCDYNLGDYS